MRTNNNIAKKTLQVLGNATSKTNISAMWDESKCNLSKI